MILLVAPTAVGQKRPQQQQQMSRVLKSEKKRRKKENKRRKSTKHCCKNLSAFKKQSLKSQTGKLIKLITTENVELAERFSQNV